MRSKKDGWLNLKNWVFKNPSNQITEIIFLYECKIYDLFCSSIIAWNLLARSNEIKGGSHILNKKNC